MMDQTFLTGNWKVKFFDNTLQLIQWFDRYQCEIPVTGEFVNLRDGIHGRVRYIVNDYNYEEVSVILECELSDFAKPIE